MNLAAGFYETLPGKISWDHIPGISLANKVLLADPSEFQVVDVKNAHMEGNAGKTNVQAAIRQWESLKAVYSQLVKEKLLDKLVVLPAVKGAEDFVFAANQSFPFLSEKQEKQVVISRMKHASRQREIPAFETFYQNEDYQLLYLDQQHVLEGMGDCIPVPGKRLVVAGYGHRTEKTALQELAGLLHIPIIGLELMQETFYHLDTCFIPVDARTAFYIPEAFHPQGRDLLSQLFTNLVAIPEEEALHDFALNAQILSFPGHQPVAIIQHTAVKTISFLKKSGFRVFPVDTGEFMQSGGSVFCMKMMFY